MSCEAEGELTELSVELNASQVACMNLQLELRKIGSAWLA
jgi:hypothetical protein